MQAPNYLALCTVYMHQQEKIRGSSVRHKKLISSWRVVKASHSHISSITTSDSFFLDEHSRSADVNEKRDLLLALCNDDV